MPAVVICFLDGEVLHAETPHVSFDRQVIEAEVRGADPNNERALFPVTAIRQLLVGDPVPAPDSATVAEWDRAAFHFVDGDVLRASIRSDVMFGRYGGVWQIVEPGSEELLTIAIPYAALKGVYHIRQWDSRPLTDRIANGRVEQLARILAEREANLTAGEAPQRRVLLSRMGRSRADSQETGTERARDV